MKIKKEIDNELMIVKLWLWSKEGSNTCYYNFDNEGRLQQQTRDMSKAISLDDQPQPFLTLPYPFFNEFAQDLVNLLASEGIKTNNDHKLEGKLEATEKHLDDLHKIVFKQLKIDS